MNKTKSLSARLGLTRIKKLTAGACQLRANFLRKRVEKGVYKGELRRKALNHAAWYTSKSNQLRGRKAA